MYNNKDYYLKELARARQRTHDDISEGGPDYNHVIIDALDHLEQAIDEGFKPWESYDGPTKCFRVLILDKAVHADIWADSIEGALKEFRKSMPSTEISAITQVC